jgi:hypothetical protein
MIFLLVPATRRSTGTAGALAPGTHRTPRDHSRPAERNAGSVSATEEPLDQVGVGVPEDVQLVGDDLPERGRLGAARGVDGEAGETAGERPYDIGQVIVAWATSPPADTELPTAAAATYRLGMAARYWKHWNRT